MEVSHTPLKRGKSSSSWELMDLGSPPWFLDCSTPTTKFAKRISAHRQTWFESNTLDLTPRARENLEASIRSLDQREYSRWRQEYAAERVGAAIYDLIDADTMLARSISDLVRRDKIAAAQDKAKTPSPIQVVNELLRLSNLPIVISVEEPSEGRG